MRPNEIREVVGGVIPPKDQKEVTATTEEREEISKMCPFFGSIVKGEEKGIERDGFLSGLTETFVRIWRALTENGYQALVSGLELNDLYAADKQLSETGTTMLEAEYPYISMHVPGNDQFAAGVRAAYGIVEFTIEKKASVPDMDEQSLDQTRESTAADLLGTIEDSDLMPKQGVAADTLIPSKSGGIATVPWVADNSESDHGAVAPAKIFVFTAAKEGSGDKWIVSWPIDGNTINELNDMVSMASSLFGTEISDKVHLTTAEGRVVCYFAAEDKNV